MWGRGLRGNNGACSTLCPFSVAPSATHNQIGPFWCWFLGRWACVHSRTLWVSPANSPVRLGVSPAAASTPTGVFNQWFEALFPCAGALGCAVCLVPSCSSRRMCMQMWDPQVHQLPPCRAHQLLLAGQLQLCPPCSTICHLAGSPSHHLALSPLCLAACLRPSYRSGWMFLLLSLWLSDFHSLIFWQFWLFFVFKLLLSFFLLF